MQKTVRDNIIYVEKPKMSLIPLALSAASLLFVALGAASLFYLQKPLEQVQETRNQASVGSGQVILTSQLVSSPTYTAGVPSVIELKYNSQGVQLSGIQIVTRVMANTETPLIEVPATSNLQTIFQEVEQVSGGYLVSVIVVPKTVGDSFSSTTPTTFAKLTVPLLAPGSITLSYDRANSFATVANSSPPDDQLRTPIDITYTIGALSSPSPSPSPSPSVSPSPSPTPSVSPSPSPSIPAGDDFWLPTNGLVVRFFTNDSSRTEVPTGDLRPYQSYIAQIQYTVQNALKSSTTNTTPIQTAFVINGQGNSYVTNDLPYSLIANHRDGASNTVETTFSTLPNNSLRITVDANNRYAETNEGNGNVVVYNFDADGVGTGGQTQTGLQRTCNQYCADSRECAAGYTCFYNKCRRPDNPDSVSCSAPSSSVTTAIAKACNVGCNVNKDCAVNLRCYQGYCRLATNPSSLSCSAATARVITSGSSSKGEKGEEISMPSESPNSSSFLEPSTQPTVSVAPSASPLLSARTGSSSSTDSFFAKFLAGLQARGISVPVVAVVVGLILFLLALLFAILGQTNNRPPQVTAQKEFPKTPYEDELQKKINALKTKTNKEAGSISETPKINRTIDTQKEEVAAASMMGRLRERGVLDNMPEAKTPPSSKQPEQKPPQSN